MGKKPVHDFDWDDVAAVSTNQHSDIQQLSDILNESVYAVGVQLQNQWTFNFFVDSPGDYTTIGDKLGQGLRTREDVAVDFAPELNFSYMR